MGVTAAVLERANGTARLPLLADAIRGFLADPAVPGAQDKLAAVMSSYTDAEHEAAWRLVSPQPPAASRRYQGPPAGARLLPLDVLPRQDPRPAATPAPRVRWRPRIPAVDGGTAIRLTAAVSVLGVAAIAAVVSYTHIYDLAVAHHESGTAARLLPVSVDGLIVSASMTLLDAARKRLDAPPVAYLMLWLGVGATVAANIAFGLPYGRLAAIVAAWPAVSFVGSVEMALTLARNKAGGDRGGRRSWRPWRRRKTAIPVDTMADPPEPPPVTPPAKPPVPRPPRPPRPPANLNSRAAKAAKADAAIAANPGMTNAEIAKLAGVSERTVERRREAARKATSP
jgi:hypothetical protein